MKTHILTLTLSFIFCLTARAELKWEQTAVELRPARGDKQAIGHFKYQNAGKTPVHFKSVHAGKDFSVKNIKVTSSSPDFQTKVAETGEGQFKVDVQPNETSRLIASTLTIQSENSPKTFYATARITTAPTAPGVPAIQKAPGAPAAPAAPTAPARPPAPGSQTH